MVTPFSQYVATQASINVVLGERYKQIVDDLIYYALGFWGKDAAAAIDPDVMDRVMSSQRAKELKNWEPPEPTLATLKEKYGSRSLSDDEFLLRYIIGSEDDITAMRAAGPVREDKYLSAATPLQALIGELLKRPDIGYVGIQAKGVKIAMGR